MSFLLRIAAVVTLLIMGGVAGVEFSSLSWPSTVATVQQAGWDSELNLAHRGGSDYRILYQYQVGANKYENSLIGFGNEPSILHILNTKEERQPREDDQVTVYYAPFYPGFSVLQPGPASNLWIWGIVAVLISLLFWMVAKVMQEPVI